MDTSNFRPYPGAPTNKQIQEMLDRTMESNADVPDWIKRVAGFEEEEETPTYEFEIREQEEAKAREEETAFAKRHRPLTPIEHAAQALVKTWRDTRNPEHWLNVTNGIETLEKLLKKRLGDV